MFPVLISAWLGSDPGPPETVARVLEVDIDTAESTCLTPEVVWDGISETLAVVVGAPVEHATAPVTLRLRVLTQASGFSASIELSGVRGSRRQRVLTIEQNGCEDLRDAVVLVSSLLFDDLWREEQLKVAEPAPELRPLIVSTRREAEPEGWSLMASTVGLFSYHDLPGPTGGVGLRIEFDAPRRFSVGTVATAWPRATRRDHSGHGGRFSAYEGGAFACIRIHQRKNFQLAPCVGGRAGVTHATGIGLEGGQGSLRPRGVLDAGLGGKAWLGGPAWLSFGLGLGIPLIRDTYRYRASDGTSESIHRAWPVIPMAWLGLGLAGRLGNRSGS